LPSVVLSHLFD